MSSRPFAHFTDDQVREELERSLARHREHRALMLSRLAELEARGLYRAKDCESMGEYCCIELHIDEEEAEELVLAGRTARRFPVLFEALADGRLDTVAILQLAPHLNDENVLPWLDAAAGLRPRQLAIRIAERFGPRPPEPPPLAVRRDD